MSVTRREFLQASGTLAVLFAIPACQKGVETLFSVAPPFLATDWLLKHQAT